MCCAAVGPDVKNKKKCIVTPCFFMFWPAAGPGRRWLLGAGGKKCWWAHHHFGSLSAALCPSSWPDSSLHQGVNPPEEVTIDTQRRVTHTHTHTHTHACVDVYCKQEQ